MLAISIRQKNVDRGLMLKAKSLFVFFGSSPEVWLYFCGQPFIYYPLCGFVKWDLDQGTHKIDVINQFCHDTGLDSWKIRKLQPDQFPGQILARRVAEFNGRME